MYARFAGGGAFRRRRLFDAGAAEKEHQITVRIGQVGVEANLNLQLGYVVTGITEDEAAASTKQGEKRCPPGS